MKAKELTLKPSYLWIPEQFAYVFYHKELQPFCDVVFSFLQSGSEKAAGFQLNGRTYTYDFNDHPATQIIPEFMIRSDKKMKVALPIFKEALQEHSAILSRHAKVLFLMKKMFVTLKNDDPETYFHYIPQDYRGLLLDRVPHINGGTQASDHDAGYGYFPEAGKTFESHKRIFEVKKDFTQLYETLAAEELLKKLFGE